jgi:hypothetical protein
MAFATITILSACTTIAPTKIIRPCDEAMVAQFPLPKADWMIAGVSEDRTYYIVNFLRKDRTKFLSVGVAGVGTENQLGMIKFGFKEIERCVGKNGDAGVIMVNSGNVSLESPHDNSQDLGI